MRRASLKALSVVTVAGALLFAASPLALAATGSGSFTSTCNPATYGYDSDGVFYNHAATGTISVKQTASDPTVESRIALVSSNGNWTGGKVASNGQSVSWSGTLKGSYKVAAATSSQVNCNGAWPGNGNYKFSYSITY